MGLIDILCGCVANDYSVMMNKCKEYILKVKKKVYDTNKQQKHLVRCFTSQCDVLIDRAQTYLNTYFKCFK